MRCNHYGSADAKIFVLIHVIKLVEEIVMIHVKVNAVTMLGLGLELLIIRGVTYSSN